MFIVICLRIDLSARTNFLLSFLTVSVDTFCYCCWYSLLFDCLLFTEFQTDSSTHTCLSIKVSERAQTTPSRWFDFVNEIFTLLFCCFVSLNGFIHCASQCCRVCFFLLFSFRFCTFVYSLFLSTFFSRKNTLNLIHLVQSNEIEINHFLGNAHNKHSHFVVVIFFSVFFHSFKYKSQAVLTI